MNKLIKIHPALDFTTDTAFVTVPLNSRMGIELPGNSKYWLITSDRRIIALNEHELLRHKLYTTNDCVITDLRWSPESVMSWVEKREIRPSLLIVYKEIKAVFENYLDYADPNMYGFSAIWTMATYFFPIFDAFPIMHLTGMSGSGKSKTLDLIDKLAFNSINTSNISDASVYRLIESMRCTLLLDEIEKIASNREGGSLINHMLSGYKKGAMVIRNEKGNNDKFKPIKYEVYSPKVIANIRGVNEEALKNRCIKHILTPTQSEKANIPLSFNEAKWQMIRDNLYICMMSYWKDVWKAKEGIDGKTIGLTGYNFTNWLPILTLAKLIGPKTFESIVKLAREKVIEKEEEIEDKPSRILLQLIYDLCSQSSNRNFVKKKISDDCFIPTKIIFEQFIGRLGYEENDKPEWLNNFSVGRMVSNLQVGRGKLERIDPGHISRGYWINQNKVAVAMKRFGLK